MSQYIRHNNLGHIVNPGALDTIAVPLKATTQRSPTGHVTTTYVPGNPFLTARTTHYPSEQLKDGHLHTQQRLVLIARYSNSYHLSIADRLSYQGKNYDILGFEPLGRKRYIKIHLNPLNN
jgi:hypothetical protein